MTRWIVAKTTVVIFAVGIISNLGCSMGAHPYDCRYGAYGGLIDRLDRVHGRVGSVIDPAIVVVHGVEQPTNPEPTPATEQPATEGDTQDQSESREALREDGGDVIHVDQHGSTLEVIETHNTHDEALHR